MQNAIIYLSEVVSQQQQALQTTPVPQATTVVTHGYAPRGIVLPKASHVPVFTGPLNDTSTMLRHADHLHNLLRTYSLLTPLDDPQREENRRVSILEVANNSVECAGLLAWVDNFATAHDWAAFDAQATQHRCNLMGTDRYPSDAQMALVYRAACPDSLYPRVKTKVGVSHGKVPTTTPNSSTLAHPVSHYHDPKTPLSYYLSRAGKYICEVFTKENCCNDCCQVGHGYKTCPNRRSSARSFAHLVDSHEVLIQELTSQLANHSNLGTHLDTEPDLYALFHPPLVIQISAATDRHTSTAPPHPLRFLLDMGAGTSFFDPSVVAKLGWKVHKDVVEHTMWLAGGKPGPVVRDVTGGSFRVRNANFMVDGVVMALNSTYDGILGLNFCKRYGLLEQSPLLHHLLDSSGKVPMVNDVTVPMRHPQVSHAAKVSPTSAVPQPSALRSTKLSAITPPNSVTLGRYFAISWVM
ncbi:hypothetical protein C362_00388 [Cryptococcus neoformans Bt1]|nr:hypothetical protein C362_00388 [Cryptococcus neoformans var. grubii Bt1]